MSSVTDWPRVALDSGGMARVFLALRPGEGGGGRVVAVKEMHAHLAQDRECRLRFLDEARITARVHHPNVVEILELAQAPDGPKIVMEYVNGVALSQIVKRLAARGARMPEHHIAAVMRGVLNGLHAAHEAKTEDGQSLRVVHRDVTPRNILVGVDGVPRLIDFGIARAALRDAPATRTGVARGTPFYMAPEQLGDGVLSRGTDIFLCGLILWELVTGRRLSQTFQNEGQFWLMIAQGRMPRARDYAPLLSAGIEQVIERALAASPQARYPSAEAMLAAILAELSPSSAADLGQWVADVAADDLTRQRRLIESLRSGARIEPEPEEQDAAPPGTMSDAGPVTQTETAPATKTETAAPVEVAPAPLLRVRTEPMPGAPEQTRTTLQTDERVTVPRLKSEAVPALSEETPTPRFRRGALLPVAGSLLFVTLVALAVLRGTAPPAAGDPEPPPAPSAAAPGSASVEPPASAATTTEAPLAAPKETAGIQSSAAVAHSTAPPSPRPASTRGCTYKDEKKITRIAPCASPECRRPGRICKPIGQR